MNSLKRKIMTGNNTIRMEYGYWLGWIIGFIILVIIIVLVIKIVNPRKRLKESNKKPPLDIIKDRYSKGKISKNEFEETKKGLK